MIRKYAPKRKRKTLTSTQRQALRWIETALISIVGPDCTQLVYCHFADGSVGHIPVNTWKSLEKRALIGRVLDGDRWLVLDSPRWLNVAEGKRL